jgi:hypothetical protein
MLEGRSIHGICTGLLISCQWHSVASSGIQWHPVSSSVIQDTETTEMEAVARCWLCFCILAASSLFWVRFSSDWLGGSWASRAWSDPQLIPNFQAQSTPGLLNLARWKRLNDAQHHGTLQKWQLVQQAKKHHNSNLRTVTRNLEPRHRLSER